MSPLDLVRLTRLMERTDGRPEVLVGLVDGPVAMDHPDLASDNIRGTPGEASGACTLANSIACTHGTFVAGVLAARRTSSAPAICPGCTVLARPIFAESIPAGQTMPSATPDELAEAILDCIRAGARVINLSAALMQATLSGQIKLEEALNQAASRGVIIVAAAGNQGVVGSTSITKHPWVIPVAACDLRGRPLEYSNLGNSISRRGLSAPGDNITSVGTNGSPLAFSGTSAAAPFVTGAIALLWSLFPGAKAAEVRYALTGASIQRRATIVPPLLDAWRACQVLKDHFGGRT